MIDETTRPSKPAQAVGLLAWLLIAAVAGGIGSAASLQAGSFYAQLERPAWAPPAWVFGPVWTVLYAMMGVAAWLVWRVGGFGAARVVLILFLVQLAFNALWSWLFFGWQLGAFSVVDIGLLWILILTTIVCFWRIRAWAGALLIPYLLWVSYAAALNYAIWSLNPDLL